MNSGRFERILMSLALVVGVFGLVRGLGGHDGGWTTLAIAAIVGIAAAFRFVR